MEKNRKVDLTDDEEAEWQRYEYLEHLVRVAKAKALQNATAHNGIHFCRKKAAVKIFNTARMKLTNSYVLAELIELAYMRGSSRQVKLDLVADLQNRIEVTGIYVDESLHRMAQSLLRLRLVRHWTLCNSICAVQLQSEGLTEAMTTDHILLAGLSWHRV